MNNKKTCETCKFFFLKKVKKTIGIFKKREIISSKPICLRFGVYGIDSYIARLSIESHFLPDSSGSPHTSHTLTEGPCGSEGKFWESKN